MSKKPNDNRDMMRDYFGGMGIVKNNSKRGE